MFSQRNRELHKAIYADNYAKVIQCLDVGPKRERKKLVDQVDNDGYTPLSTAARFGRIKIVTALLDRGAVIDKVTYCGRSALLWACLENKRDAAELLLARGADIEFRRTRYQRGQTPLLAASEGGHVDLVRLLLDRGADINRADDYSFTPLMRTCQRESRVEVLEFLLDREAKTNYRIMADACFSDSVAVVGCLLARGLSVTAASRGAAQNKPAIKALLDAAAPPEKRRLAHWINRIHLHVVGPRGDHQGSARHRLLNCRHLARHLVSFLLVKERVTVH